MMSCLEKVAEILGGLSENVYHYEALDADAPYIVWAEDSEYNALDADNYKAGQAVEGTIDLYTKDADEPLISSIPQAMNTARISWMLNSVQYEDDTELLHYEWVFRVRESWQG